ncbi:hypothetical protein [Proteus mirabilis]|uniref:hypothetical protein n=1 Tax=Proteus mirabilis TaxID=584 RepID=UPI0030C6CCAA
METKKKHKKEKEKNIKKKKNPFPKNKKRKVDKKIKKPSKNNIFLQINFATDWCGYKI